MATFSIIAVSLLALLVLPSVLVELVAGKRVFYEAAGLLDHEAIVVLGCPPLTHLGGPNPHFIRRLDACETLYRAGYAKRIILSGAARHDVNEPDAMARELMARGVPGSLLEQDRESFRTVDSVVRTKEVFGVQRAVVVSQRFHNLRALTLARTLGLDWVGFCASDPAATPWMRRWTRESAARIRMIGDILLLFLSRS